ncbi:MAG: RNA polymerase sigma-70 factor [Ginsengibacter sp.]|jgi:RNA polymerase sigma-70 factor (ECF subfamily)
MNINGDFADSVQRKLLQQIASGNESAFRQLYHNYYKRLLQFALIFTKKKEVAEELVEDVFIKFWKNRANSEAIRNLKVYLYTATKNTCLNYLSSKAHESITKPLDEINIELSGPICPDQLLIFRETFTIIKNAIETLPPRCKVIFKLIREDGLKYKEVAEILNLSPHTIDAQMTIALRRIAFLLKEEFEKAPGAPVFKK